MTINWEKLFKPRSIAVVGASTKKGLNINMFFTSLVGAKFPGRLYPVNSKAREVEGYPAYPSVKDIPDPVDYVIIAVPRDHVMQVIRDCIAKEVPVAHIFTAGFGETTTPEGEKLNRELRELIAGRIRLIGPNCVGVYCPGSHIAYIPSQPIIAGDIGFVSQSGGHNSLFVQAATSQGLYFSKAVSVGNSMDLGVNDFLEYLGEDPDTGIIGVYVEGMREGQGRRFLDLVRTISPKKPVMLMKAGRGEAGARAAAGHTGSIAGTYSLWEYVAVQANAVLVDDYTEMADFVWAYRNIPRLAGLRTGAVAGGGGNSVWSGDMLSSLGLTLPPLSPETQRKILSITDAVGTIARNPVDPNFSMFDPEAQYGVFTTLDAQPDIDFLVNVTVFDLFYHATVASGMLTAEQAAEEVVLRLATVRQRVNKPFVTVIIQVSENAEMTAIINRIKRKARSSGVPCYSDFRRMAGTMVRLYKYLQRRDAVDENTGLPRDSAGNAAHGAC